MGADAAALLLVAGTALGGLLVDAAWSSDMRDGSTARKARHPRADACITKEVVRSMHADGYAVVHDVLSAAEVRRARDDAMMARAQFHRADNGADVRQDVVVGVGRFACARRRAQAAEAAANDGIERAAPRAFVDCASDRQPGTGLEGAGLAHAIGVLRGVCWALESAGYDASVDHVVPMNLQLSFFAANGAQYVPHIDACLDGIGQLGLRTYLQEVDARGRVITAVLYLNDAPWEPSDGGALELDVPPAARRVGPAGGTLVILDARTVRHAVLPTYGSRDRLALSCFVNGQSVRAPSNEL